MKHEWKVVERHWCDCLGVSHQDKRVVSVCHDYESAVRELSHAFDARWNEHAFPSELWLSECVPPEESPANAWFASKFVDEGEYSFQIEQVKCH